MILIPPGKFQMGSTDEEVEAAMKFVDEIKGDPRTKERIQNAERPRHLVVLTKPFLMSATEVTIGQFTKFVEASKYVTDAEKANGQTFLNPGYAVTDDSPAAFISWNDAVAYCQWLSTQEKTTYRLPTGAEWEYACRAGTTTQFSFGDDDNELTKYDWYNKNAGGKSHPVGKLLPNHFGLFDMHGNVWEWCGDYQAESWYSRSPLNDPIGPPDGSNRGMRGGDWFNFAPDCRGAANSYNNVSSGFFNGGFRVVEELGTPPPLRAVVPFDAKSSSTPSAHPQEIKP